MKRKDLSERCCSDLLTEIKNKIRNGNACGFDKHDGVK